MKIYKIINKIGTESEMSQVKSELLLLYMALTL